MSHRVSTKSYFTTSDKLEQYFFINFRFIIRQHNPSHSTNQHPKPRAISQRGYILNNKQTFLITIPQANNLKKKLNRLLILVVVYQIRKRYCKYISKRKRRSLKCYIPTNIEVRTTCALFKSPTMVNKLLEGLVLSTVRVFRSVGLLLFCKKPLWVFVLAKVWMRMFTVSLR